jgi:tetratricopeptide (TPR) repeat protein
MIGPDDDSALPASSDGLDDLLARVAATDSVADTPVPPRVGRYDVRERIGRGGFGVVHSGWDPQLLRAVALKFVRPDRSAGVAGQQLATRLRREAQVLARLDHPSIVKVFDVGETEGGIWIAMELLDGVTVRDWLARRRSWHAIVDVFVRAAQGLATGHDAGIVHRDIKPDNVMLAANGRVVVVDFGLAGVPDEVGSDPIASTPGNSGDARLTETGAFVGTRGYVAPEAVAGGLATPASDQYALCISLADALWGRDAVERSLAGATTDRPLARVGIGRVPPALWSVVRRGLAVRPESRHASMHALVDELRRHSRPLRAAWLLAIPIAVVLALVAGRSFRAEDTTDAPAAVSAGLTTLRAQSLLSSGRQAMHARRPDASGLLESAFLESTRCGDDRLAFSAALALVDQHTYSGELQTAQSWLDRATALQQLLADPSAEADLLRRTAYLYIRTGRSVEAIDAAQTGVALRESITPRDPTALAADLYIAAAAHVEGGALDEARGEYLRAIAIETAARGPDHPSVALTLANLGNLEIEAGLAADALRHFERALAIDEQHEPPDSQRLVIDRCNVANATRAAGDPAAALALLRAELPAIERFGNELFLAETLAVLGDIHDALGEPRAAMTAYQRALAIYQARMDEHQGQTVGEIELSIGRQWHQLGDDSRALVWLGHARESLVGSTEPETVARLWIEHARAELALGRADEATAHAQLALDTLATAPNADETRRDVEAVLVAARRRAR